MSGSPYAIWPTNAVGTGLANYDITYLAGDLIITVAALEVTADNKTKDYGAVDPLLTWQITSGSLQPSDVLTGALTRAPGENVGTYPIRQGTLSAGANYVLTFTEGLFEIVDLAPDVNVLSMNWTLNFATGLFEGTLAAINNGAGPVPADYDYWFRLPVTAEWRLWITSGSLPDGKTYVNLTSAVRAELAGTGNRDQVWDPGEQISVSGMVMYHRRRVNPRNYVVPSEAFTEGRLFQEADSDQNSVLSAVERDTALEEWENGRLTDGELLDAVRLSRGAAYLWSKEIRAWECLENDLR